MKLNGGYSERMFSSVVIICENILSSNTTQHFCTKPPQMAFICTRRLTAGDGVPGPAVDDVVVRLEVLVVADAPVRVGHHQVCGGVDGGQPAEESVVGRGGVFLRGPVTGAVEGIRDHQFPPVEVRAEHEGDVLHPADDGARLRCDLGGTDEPG